VVVALVIGAGIYFTYNSSDKSAAEPATAEQAAPDAANP